MSSVKKSFAYQSAYQILKMILPLVTAPYIARVLGTENSGIYSHTFSVVNFFVVFSMLGLEQYGNKCIARVRDNKEQRDQVFSELATLHFIVSIIVLLSYLFFTFFITQKYRVYFVIQTLYVVSSVFDVNWLFFGLEKFKTTVIRNMIIKIITVVCIFLFVKKKEDLWVYTLIISSGTLLSECILWRFVPKYVSYVKFPVKTCFKHMKPLLILFVALIAAHVYRMMDKVMLGWFNQLDDLGCYEYADKIVRIPLSLITALGTVMLSRMSNLFAKKETDMADKLLNKSALFVLFMSFAMAFGIAGISPEFVILFLGDAYEETKVLLMLLAITIPFVGFNNFVRTQLLIPLNRDKIYTNAVCIGAIVNIVFNALFIPFFSARGAAIATIVAYVSVFIAQIIPILKSTKVKDYFKIIPFPLAIGACMYIVVRLIGNALGQSILTVVIEIVSGALFYSICTMIFLYFYDKSFLYTIFSKIYKNK